MSMRVSKNVDGSRRSLFVPFDMFAVKIHTNGLAEILGLTYSTPCLEIVLNFLSRWCLWFLRNE